MVTAMFGQICEDETSRYLGDTLDNNQAYPPSLNCPHDRSNVKVKRPILGDIQALFF